MCPSLLLFFLWLYAMTTRKAASIRVEEEIHANAEFLPQDNQDSSQEHVPLGEKAPFNPLSCLIGR